MKQLHKSKHNILKQYWHNNQQVMITAAPSVFKIISNSLATAYITTRSMHITTIQHQWVACINNWKHGLSRTTYCLVSHDRSFVSTIHFPLTQTHKSMTINVRYKFSDVAKTWVNKTKTTTNTETPNSKTKNGSNTYVMSLVMLSVFNIEC